MSEHSEILHQLDLEAEGELSPAESRRLADHLEGCADCRAAHRRAVALVELLDGAKVPVAAGFSARVMAALPEPAWRTSEQRAAEGAHSAAPRRALAWAVALFAVLALVSTLLLIAALGGASGLPGGGLLAAVGRMAVAAVVTGAGLLGASWSGVGLAVGELFASAPGTLVAFALLLLFLSGLLFVLLRRPRGSAATPRQRSDGKA